MGWNDEDLALQKLSLITIARGTPASFEIHEKRRCGASAGSPESRLNVLPYENLQFPNERISRALSTGVMSRSWVPTTTWGIRSLLGCGFHRPFRYSERRTKRLGLKKKGFGSGPDISFGILLRLAHCACEIE
jgi:hypothetical protein